MDVLTVLLKSLGNLQVGVFRDALGWFVVRSTAVGVTSQGRTIDEALDNLIEAIELHNEEVPEGFDEDLEPADAPWF